MICKYFSLLWVVFAFSLVSFDVQKYFILMKHNLLTFLLSLVLFVSYLNHCLSQEHKDLTLFISEFPELPFKCSSPLFGQIPEQSRDYISGHNSSQSPHLNPNPTQTAYFTISTSRFLTGWATVESRQGLGPA